MLSLLDCFQNTANLVSRSSNPISLFAVTSYLIIPALFHHRCTLFPLGEWLSDSRWPSGVLAAHMFGATLMLRTSQTWLSRRPLILWKIVSIVCWDYFLQMTGHDSFSSLSPWWWNIIACAAFILLYITHPPDTKKPVFVFFFWGGGKQKILRRQTENSPPDPFCCCSLAFKLLIWMFYHFNDTLYHNIPLHICRGSFVMHISLLLIIKDTHAFVCLLIHQLCCSFDTGLDKRWQQWWCGTCGCHNQRWSGTTDFPSQWTPTVLPGLTIPGHCYRGFDKFCKEILISS